MVQSRADLSDDLVRQITGRASSLYGRNAVRDAVQERTGEHVSRAGQILRLAWKCSHVSLGAVMPDVSAMRSVCYHNGWDVAVQLFERFFRGLCARYRARFAFIAEEEVRVLERFTQRIAEYVNDESVGTGDRNFRLVLLRDLDGFPDCLLPGIRVGENVAFDEQPFGTCDAALLDVFGCEMARDSQARPHRAFRVRGHEADTRACSFVDDDRVSDIDSEFLELARIKQAISVVSDAANESSLASELGKGDHGVGDRPAADEFGFVLLIPVEQDLLILQIHEPHTAAFKPERCKFRVRNF